VALSPEISISLLVTTGTVGCSETRARQTANNFLSEAFIHSQQHGRAVASTKKPTTHRVWAAATTMVKRIRRVRVTALDMPFHVISLGEGVVSGGECAGGSAIW
jgi:hypothetical protein